MKTIITRKSGKQSRVRNFEAKVLIALGLADEVVAVKAPKPAPEPVRVKRTYQRRDMVAATVPEVQQPANLPNWTVDRTLPNIPQPSPLYSGKKPSDGEAE